VTIRPDSPSAGFNVLCFDIHAFDDYLTQFEGLHDFTNFASIFASDYLNSVTSFDVHLVTPGYRALRLINHSTSGGKQF